MELGDKLKKIRTEKHITLRQVQNDTGINFSNLAQIERKEHSANSETLKILANYYNVSVDYLLGKTDNPNAQIITIADDDGSIRKIEYELLDKVKGFTVDDFIELNRYIDFMKSKKGGSDEK